MEEQEKNSGVSVFIGNPACTPRAAGQTQHQEAPPVTPPRLPGCDTAAACADPGNEGQRMALNLKPMGTKDNTSSLCQDQPVDAHFSWQLFLTASFYT